VPLIALSESGDRRRVMRLVREWQRFNPEAPVEIVSIDVLVAIGRPRSFQRRERQLKLAPEEVANSHRLSGGRRIHFLKQTTELIL
jgi:hypothetical protein